MTLPEAIEVLKRFRKDANEPPINKELIESLDIAINLLTQINKQK